MGRSQPLRTRAARYVAGACAGAAILLLTLPAPHASTPETVRRPTSTTAPTTSAAATTPTTAAPTTAAARRTPVVLAFGGDVHFEGALRTKLARDPAHVFDPVAPALAGADVAMVNLETAITERGRPEPKQYRFRAPASAFTALASAGIDVATMANNHGRDYGVVGLIDTLAAISNAPVKVVGIGADASAAFAPARLTVRGQRVAVLAATDVLDGALEASWTATDTQPGLASAKQPDRLLAGVRSARVDSDLVVVYLHWGVEGATCPSARQRQLASALVDAGADVIVGSHSHRQQGAGHEGDAFVDYGLGNFAFYNESGASGVTGVLVLTVTGRHVDWYHWLPAHIRGGVPVITSVAARQPEVDAWNGLRLCSGLAP